MKTLALTCILKNEENTALKVVKSVEDVVDEFAIGVDDKSQDKTYDVLKEYFDKLGKPYSLFYFTWENDFSKARNQVLEKVKSDWVFVLDGDEWLEESSKQIILDLKNNNFNSVDGIECQIYMNPDKYKVPVCAFYSPRLASSVYRWKNPSHNVLDISCNKLQMNKNIILYHSRVERKKEYNEERTKQRDEMNIKNLLTNAENNKNDPRAQFYLANTYWEAGQIDEAIEWYKKYFKIATWNEEIWEAYYNLANCYRAKKDPSKAIDACLSGRKYDKRRTENLVLAAEICYYDLKDFDQAYEHCYNACFDKDSNEIPIPFDCSLFVNHTYYKTYRWDLLSMCCHHLNKFNEAIKYGYKVLEVEFDNARVKNNIELWKQEVKQKTGRPGTVIFYDRYQSFSKDIIDYFKKFYDVEVRANYDGEDLSEYKFVWFEWCDENIIKASQFKHNTKLICRFHSFEYFSGYHKRVNWLNVDKTIFVSNHVRDNVLDDLKIDLKKYAYLKDNSKVIFNGVDCNKFTFIERKKGYNLAFYGYFNHKKNIPLLIHLLFALPKEYNLHLIGSFQDEYLHHFYMNYNKVQDLSNRMHLHAWTDNIDKKLDELDINYVVSPSLFEGFGYHIAESMAKGTKPIIFFRQGVESLWPKDLIVKTIPEAVDLIRSKHYDSKSYRQWIEERYKLEDKIKEISDYVSS